MAEGFDSKSEVVMRVEQALGTSCDKGSTPDRRQDAIGRLLIGTCENASDDRLLPPRFTGSK